MKNIKEELLESIITETLEEDTQPGSKLSTMLQNHQNSLTNKLTGITIDQCFDCEDLLFLETLLWCVDYKTYKKESLTPLDKERFLRIKKILRNKLYYLGAYLNKIEIQNLPEDNFVSFPFSLNADDSDETANSFIEIISKLFKSDEESEDYEETDYEEF